MSQSNSETRPVSFNEQKQCPECGFFWQGEDIFAHFLKMKEEGDPYYANKTEEEIREVAGHYGWTEENPRCFSRLVGVELPYGHPDRYDGVSYWMCPKCRTTWNRWTTKKEEIPEHKVIK